jgi:hypothetical protein
MGFPPVKIVPQFTQRYFLPVLVLVIMRLPNNRIMARLPLIRIMGTMNDGSTAFIKKYASNPRTATPAKINPNVLMTSSFELIPKLLQNLSQGWDY